MNYAKPFVKWAGGKGSLISQITEYYPFELKDGRIEKYIEPFVGGGAILIHILQNYEVDSAIAFDINADLINCYKSIKDTECLDNLISNLKEKCEKYKSLKQDDRKQYFYKIREKYNSYSLKEDEINPERASEFIFLNKTCFNGLYRVNSKNEFNVPFNNAKNPSIYEEENLKELSRLFREHNVEFYVGDYKKANTFVDKNTFVYFDPPYRPLSTTSAFTSYTKDSFNDENQKELAEFYKEISQKDARLMLSNSNPKNTNKEDDFFDELYKGFNINTIMANRNINSKADGRKAISELLITNYKVD